MTVRPALLALALLPALAAPGRADVPKALDALVVFDGQVIHLPAAICRLDVPVAYAREDGRLTLRLAAVTCTERLFANGFDAAATPPTLPPGFEPR